MVSEFKKGVLKRLGQGVACFFAIASIWATGDVLPEESRSKNAPWGERPNFTKLMLDGGNTVGEVLAIEQDQYGFIWVAGKSGLARYDGYKVKFYQNDPNDPNSLSNNFVYDLHEDSFGELWIATEGGGVLRYNRAMDEFIAYNPQSNDKNTLSGFIIREIYEDNQQRLWIGSENGISLYNRETDDFTRFLDTSSLANYLIEDIEQISPIEYLISTNGGGLFLWNRNSSELQQFVQDRNTPGSIRHTLVRDVLKDTKGRIWVGDEIGLSQFHPDTQTFSYIEIPSVYPDKENMPIWHILEDENGILWLCSDGGSLYHFNPETRTIGNYATYENKVSGLSTSIIRTIFQDRNKDFWIGHFPGGVSYLDRSNTLFETYRGFAFDSVGGVRNGIWSFLEDGVGNFWIGTNGAGIYFFDREKKKIDREYKGRDFSNVELPLAVLSLHRDRRGDLWLGSWSQGLYRFDPDTGEAETFSSYMKGKNQFPGDNVWDIEEDEEGYLWIATMNNGLFKFDPVNKTYTNYRNSESKDSLANNSVWALQIDKLGRLWAGTHSGISRFDKNTETFDNFLYSYDDANTISHFWVDDFYEDSLGNFWVGTSGGGLNLYHEATDSFSYVRAADGLADDSVVGILEEDHGIMWITTRGGITRYDQSEKSFRSFDRDNWLQDDAFNMGAVYKLSTGEMVVGGVNGFSLFDPKRITANEIDPKVYFTEFELFNHTVKPDEQDSPLQKQVMEAEKITLKHNQSVFTLRFTTVSYRVFGKNMYSYKLEGFDTKWLAPTTSNSATYTNLDPGEYTFKVKAKNNDGVWSRAPAEISIIVLPPWWKTWWAYSIYIFVLLSLIYLYVSSQRKKIQREQEINVQLREVDKLKDKILENTSHELRTPINGIIGLAEAIKHDENDVLAEKTEKNLDLIISSGKRLSNIVNDILDFSKIKQSGIDFSCHPCRVKPLIYEVLDQTIPLIKEDFIHLEYEVPDDLSDVLANPVRFKQIIANLLSNAIKYTAEGSISLVVKNQEKYVSVSVSDTGIGIEKEQQKRIFESFSQSTESGIYTKSGAGLGLTVTKQLVEKHGGQIYVDSELGDGATFTVTFPVSKQKAVIENEQSFSNLENYTEKQKASDTKEAEINARPDKPIAAFSLPSFSPAEEASEELQAEWVKVLVVDDEAVNRMVMRHLLLARKYKVFEAENGQQAIDAFKAGMQFDLVFLDVMMPGLSGYEVCKEIRNLYAFNEVPVIFFTAKTQVDDLVEGFQVGGNDFLAKPIVKEELYARADAQLKLLRSHRTLEERVEKRTKDLEITRHKLESVRTIDQLTGFYNRGYLLNRVPDDIRDAVECGEQEIQSKPSQLLFYLVDLDNFREVNDAYGYTAGDLVLEQLSQVLNMVVGKNDYIVRWGGCKLLIVSPGASLDKAPLMAEALVEAFRHYDFSLGDGHHVRKTCSIGYTAYPVRVPKEQIDWPHIIEVAECALGAAKLSGRNAWIGLLINESCPLQDVENIRTNQVPDYLSGNQMTLISSFDNKSLIQWS